MENPQGHSPLARNLLLNYAALDGVNHWTTPAGEPQPQVEDSIIGAEPIKNCLTIDGPVKHWVTSNRYASMHQEVNLLQEGFPVDLLDTQRPPIYSSVWYARRVDCESKFRFTVELLDASKQVLDKKDVEKEMTEEEGKGTWHITVHTFRGYKPGLRFIRVTMGGNDLKNWAGNYGAKFTLPTVRFFFNN